MKPRSPHTTRRAFFTMLAISATAILTMFAVVLARLSFTGMVRERDAALETAARQILDSARAWTRLHDTDLKADLPVTLAIENLLPPNTSGSLELVRRDSPDGLSSLECRLTIIRSRATRIRKAAWSLPPPSHSAKPPPAGPRFTL